MLSRLFEVDLDIGQPSSRKVFQAMMEILIDQLDRRFQSGADGSGVRYRSSNPHQKTVL